MNSLSRSEYWAQERRLAQLEEGLDQVRTKLDEHEQGLAEDGHLLIEERHQRKRLEMRVSILEKQMSNLAAHLRAEHAEEFRRAIERCALGNGDAPKR